MTTHHHFPTTDNRALNHLQGGYRIPSPYARRPRRTDPVANDRIAELLESFHKSRALMTEELGKVIVGQREVIELIFAAIFTRGHCLLVGVPGLAKTLLVSSTSRILDIAFKRIQFTPDLMPSDITGTNVIDEQETGRREFRFVQ